VKLSFADSSTNDAVLTDFSEHSVKILGFLFEMTEFYEEMFGVNSGMSFFFGASFTETETSVCRIIFKGKT